MEKFVAGEILKASQLNELLGEVSGNTTNITIINKKLENLDAGEWEN